MKKNMNVNKCILVGRITKPVEVTTTNSGKTVAKFSMATNKSWKDSQGNKQEKATFHNIVMWGKLAEIAGQYLVKGQEVYIEGMIDNRSYEDNAGVKKYITEIVADQMQMGNKPKGGDYSPHARVEQPAPQEEIPTIQLEDEAPRQQTFSEHQADIANGVKDEGEIRL
jgi:single-strand DNA-binding protein